MTATRLLLLLALTAPFWDLAHPLWEVDDARYAQVPSEMIASGDWVSPTLNGLDYIEKPPLWYWLAAGSYRLFGVGEGAARLPLALLSFAGAAGTWWLGTWLFSAGAGASAALVLLSSGLYFLLSHYITPDMGLTAALVWTTGLILRALARPGDAWWASPGAWACAGLAFLAKGLVALVLPALWVILLMLACPNLRPGLRGLLGPAGPLVFTAIVGPWIWRMSHRHHDFLQVFFVEQHFQRFLTPRYNRPGPWFFYLAVLPAALLPWTPAVAAGAAAAWTGSSGERWKGRALLLWAAVVTGFFSASSSKLAAYMLPVFPHLCLLAARALEKPLPRWSEGLSRGLGGVLLLAAVAAPAFRGRLPDPALVPAVCAALAALGAGLWLSARSGAPGMAGGAAAGLLLGALALGAARVAEPHLSALRVGRSIASQAGSQDLIYAYGTHLHGLSYYARRPVDRFIYWIGELHYAKRNPENDALWGDDNAIRALPLRSRAVYVVLRRSEAPHLRGLIEPGALKELTTYGRWALAKVTED